MLSAPYYASSMRAVRPCLCREQLPGCPTSCSIMRAASAVVLVNWCEVGFLSKRTIRAACTSSSHVVHVAAPRVHDPLELCHVIGLKIWVNICPPSFLIVRPMRKLLREVPSVVLSICTFFALRNKICWNINGRCTFLTCQGSLFSDLYRPMRRRFDF